MVRAGVTAEAVVGAEIVSHLSVLFLQKGLESFTRAMYAHLQRPDRSTEQIGHLFVRATFDVFHDERFAKRSRERSECAIQIRAKFRAVELFFRRRKRRRLIIFFVAQVRAPNVLQPVLAAIRDDSKNPRIEPPPHLGEMMIK